MTRSGWEKSDRAALAEGFAIIKAKHAFESETQILKEDFEQTAKHMLHLASQKIAIAEKSLRFQIAKY